MQEKDARNELNYQLIRIIMSNMVLENELSIKELKTFIKAMQKKYKPIIGVLDEE